MDTNRYEELEKALIQICRTSKTPVYMSYWDQVVSNFFSEVSSYVYKLKLDLDEVEAWDASEIIDILEDDFLNDSFADKINDVSIEFDVADDYDCETCGTSYTSVKVDIKGALWVVSESYGCYGGGRFEGTPEETTSYLVKSLRTLFPNPDYRVKGIIKDFMKELKTLTMEVP